MEQNECNSFQSSWAFSWAWQILTRIIGHWEILPENGWIICRDNTIKVDKPPGLPQLIYMEMPVRGENAIMTLLRL